MVRQLSNLVLWMMVAIMQISLITILFINPLYAASCTTFCDGCPGGGGCGISGCDKAVCFAIACDCGWQCTKGGQVTGWSGACEEVKPL